MARAVRPLVAVFLSRLTSIGVFVVFVCLDPTKNCTTSCTGAICWVRSTTRVFMIFEILHRHLISATPTCPKHIRPWGPLWSWPDRAIVKSSAFFDSPTLSTVLATFHINCHFCGIMACVVVHVMRHERVALVTSLRAEPALEQVSVRAPL